MCSFSLFAHFSIKYVEGDTNMFTDKQKNELNLDIEEDETESFRELNRFFQKLLQNKPPDRR